MSRASRALASERSMRLDLNLTNNLGLLQVCLIPILALVHDGMMS